MGIGITTIQVLGLDGTGTMVQVQLGPETLWVELARVQRIMRGEEKSVEALLVNAAMHAALDGISPDDLASIKASVEAATFRH